MKPTSVRGKKLYEVAWLVESECDGCYFNDYNTKEECPNEAIDGNRCDNGGPMEGMIYIPQTKKGIAEYVERRLDGGGQP